MKTLIIAILDESGSMATKQQDVIGGFNLFLAEQQKVTADEALLTLVKFNTAYSIVRSAQPIKDVDPLTMATYTPGGGTALFDAIAGAVREADKVTFDRALCLVMTDGEENSSRETTFEQVKAIIQERTARGTWTFSYVGEQPEKWSRQTGTSFGNVSQYQHATPQQSMRHISTATAVYRSEHETAKSDFLSDTKVEAKLKENDPQWGGGASSAGGDSASTGGSAGAQNKP